MKLHAHHVSPLHGGGEGNAVFRHGQHILLPIGATGVGMDKIGVDFASLIQPPEQRALLLRGQTIPTDMRNLQPAVGQAPHLARD